MDTTEHRYAQLNIIQFKSSLAEIKNVKQIILFMVVAFKIIKAILVYF